MQGKTRQTIFRIHAWIGLNIGILLYAVCLTGTLAIFSSELEWLSEPLLRGKNSERTATSPSFSWQATHDSIATAYPTASIAILTRPDGAESVAGGVIAFGPRDFRLALVDAKKYTFLGQRSTFGLSSFLRILHKQFYIVPGIFGFHGIWIVGILGLFLIVSAVTGLLSVARWKRAMFTLRVGRSKRLFLSDLHRLSGIWAIPITILFSVTGIWYLAENILIENKLMVEEAGPSAIVNQTGPGSPATRPLIDLDTAALAAEEALPGISISRVILPRRLNAPLVFQGQADAILVRDRANQVEVDPHTGKVLNIRRAEDLGPLSRWAETADPLHFGTFGGTATQVIWLVAGLALCASILSGLYGAWLRLEKDAGLPARPVFAAVIIAPSLLIILASTVGTILYGGTQWVRAHTDIQREVLARNEPVGPWNVTVLRDMQNDPSSEWIDIKFLGGFPSLTDLRVELTATADEPLARQQQTGTRIRQFADRVWVSTRPPANGCFGPCFLRIRLSTAAGETFGLVFPMPPKSAAKTALSIPHATAMAPAEAAWIGLAVLTLMAPLFGWIFLQFRRREPGGLKTAGAGPAVSR